MSAVITSARGLPTGTIAAFAGIVGAIHGCQLTALTLVTRDGRKDPRPLVSADVSGWSPTLHRVAMDWHTVLPTDWPMTRIADDTLGFAEALTRMFSAKIAIQRARAEAGVRIGTAFPLQATYENSLRIDHLHADRGPLALALSGIANPSQHLPLVTLVHPHVKQAHYDTSKYRGGPKLENQGELAQEVVVPQTSPGAGTTTLRTIRLKTHTNGSLIMYGSFLQLLGHTLPEALVAAMPGRTLGEVAEVPEVLRHRRILEAGAGSAHSRPSLWFDLEPDLVPLAPHVGTRSRERIVEQLMEGTAR
jgi:hypothetical protein